MKNSDAAKNLGETMQQQMRADKALYFFTLGQSISMEGKKTKNKV